MVYRNTKASVRNVTGPSRYSKDVLVKHLTIVEFCRSLLKHVHVLRLPLYLDHVELNLFCSLSKRLITYKVYIVLALNRILFP